VYGPVRTHFPAAFQKLTNLIRIPISWVLHLNLHPPVLYWNWFWHTVAMTV